MFIKKNNIFDGVGSRSRYAKLIYSRLITREWICYADILAEDEGAKTEDYLYKRSYVRTYKELKKAFMDVRKAIGPEHIEENGNNRNKKFRYIGKDDDPLRDMRNAKAIKDIKKYYEFCQDSAGFMPESWLEYFLSGSMDLLEIKKHKSKSEQVIDCGMDRMLKNVELLPYLYEAIKKQEVLHILYKPYGEEERELIFHPHLLKEYNGRWHIYGHAEGCEPEFAFYLALDRIEGKPDLIKGKTYVSAPIGFYKNFFKDIVGLTHKESYLVDDIIVRAHSEYMFNLMDTKRMHASQRIKTPYGKHTDGEYGDFVFHVELNNEFIGRILQMGEGLEIIGPPRARDVVKRRIQRMRDLYTD